jgi:hypothetical protein
VCLLLHVKEVKTFVDLLVHFGLINKLKVPHPMIQRRLELEALGTLHTRHRLLQLHFLQVIY